MIDRPLVSIVLPTHNRAHLIKRAIDSVVSQDYSNWELLVIDDCSTDGTEEVIAIFLKDSRIQYVRNEINLGGSGARNVGILKAKGDFITFLDSDDEYLPEKIELQLQLFETSTITNLGVINCGRLDEKNGKIYSRWIPKFRGNVRVPLLSKDKVGANTSLLMIKREVIEEGIFFDDKMPAGQDWDFLIRICLKFNLDFVDKELVIIHHHEGPRVYNKLSAIKAYSLQLLKYGELIKDNKKIYKKFLVRKALVEFVNEENELACNTIKSFDGNSFLLNYLWHSYFRIFQNTNSFFSKVSLKILLFITFD
jgi:glycosyltransferase involved in cell wall biosynthesis